MPQPNPAEPSDFDRLNLLATRLTDICIRVRAYLQQRSLVPVSVIQHFQRQRAQRALSGVYDPKDGWRVICDDPDTLPEVYFDLPDDSARALIGAQPAENAPEGDDLPYPEVCPVVPMRCSITLIKERVYLKERTEEIDSLAADAVLILRTAGPLAQHGIGESVGQYLTEVIMRVKKIVGTVKADLKALENAVQTQVIYAPWMKDWTNLFSDPGTAATDLLERELLPKLDDDACRLGSLPIASESTEPDPLEAKQTPTDQETVVPPRKPKRESRLVTLQYAANNWFRGFKTRQTLSKRIKDGTVAAKVYARGKVAFCLVELQEKSHAIYLDALPKSDESE